MQAQSGRDTPALGSLGRARLHCGLTGVVLDGMSASSPRPAPDLLTGEVLLPPDVWHAATMIRRVTVYDLAGKLALGADPARLAHDYGEPEWLIRRIDEARAHGAPALDRLAYLFGPPDQRP